MRRLFVILVMFAGMSVAAAAASGEDNPWSAWPYSLKLRVTQPQLADDSGLARVRVNLGSDAAKDWADVRVLDDKLREQPWKLLSISPAGDAEAVFYAVKGCRDYTLIFGNPSAEAARYDVPWQIGRAIIDDALPARAYIHGLWSWVKSPALSGAYAHANPIVDRFSYHGASELVGFPLSETSVIHQYVQPDADDPPEQIVFRLVFEGRRNANSWEDKKHVNLYWGARNLRDLPGRSIKMGEMPPKGKWTRLTVSLEELLDRADITWPPGGDVPDLFGVEFCADKGRAYWDLTTLGNLPAETEIVALECSAKTKPAIVSQRLDAFTVAGTEITLTEVRFTATGSDDASVAWNFGDGATAAGREASHVFVGTSQRTVTATTETQKCTRQVDLSGPAPERGFGIELVSCPFIVRADDKALFNLRLEAALPRSLDVETRATLLDASGKELGVKRAGVTLWPGDKHPAFKAWSLDASNPALARVRFEMCFGGQALASREVAFKRSSGSLDTLKLADDRFVDASGRPVVVLAEVDGGTSADGTPRSGAPSRVLVVGDVPVPEFAARLKETLHADVKQAAVVETRPSWSLPARQVLALGAGGRLDASADAVLLASAWNMMLEGVPARAASDALAACIDQLRLRARADIRLVLPPACTEREDLARQYAVALRTLGIEKRVPVVDLYSRSIALGDASPGVLDATVIAEGLVVRRLHAKVAGMTVETIADALARPAPEVRDSK